MCCQLAPKKINACIRISVEATSYRPTSQCGVAEVVLASVAMDMKMPAASKILAAFLPTIRDSVAKESRTVEILS